MLKRHNKTVTLLNASGGEIVVHDVVDIEVHFDKLRLHLEDVLVADVTFNVLCGEGLEDPPLSDGV